MYAYESNQKQGVGYLSVAANPNPESNVIFVAQPTRFSLDPGIEQVAKVEVSPRGEEGHGGFLRKGAMPKLKTVFTKGRATPALRQWIYQDLYQEATVTLPLTRTFYLPRGTGNVSIPAASPGQLGYGMVADIASAVVMQRITSGFPDLSNIQLTRLPYVSSPPALGTRSFMQGANGAYYFSEDLRGYAVTVTWEQASVKTVRKTETPIGSFRLSLLVPTEMNLYEVYLFPDAEVVAGVQDDPQADSVEIEWQAKLSGINRCNSYEHFFTEIATVC